MKEKIIEIFEDFAKDSTRIDQDCIMQEDWLSVASDIEQLLSTTEESKVDENFHSALFKEIDKLPYEKHVDDGQYNDGVIYGFEIGAYWAYQWEANSRTQTPPKLGATPQDAPQDTPQDNEEIN